jgi:hypothetical protein
MAPAEGGKTKLHEARRMKPYTHCDDEKRRPYGAILAHTMLDSAALPRLSARLGPKHRIGDSGMKHNSPSLRNS